jgi:hypothetical protein
MIHKYWNVRLHQGGSADEPLDSEENATEELRKIVKESEETVEEKVLWIWRTLSSFEEKSATCISDMLLHVSNGAYVDGVMTAKRFITHVDLLFSAADNLDQVLQSHTAKGAFPFVLLISPFLLTFPRSFLFERSQIALQEGSRVLPVACRISRNWREATRCHPRTPIPCHRLSALP